MILIRQRKEFDCAVACGAMLTGKTYEQTKQDLREVFHGGLPTASTFSYLYSEGFFVRELKRFDVVKGDVIEWPPKPFAQVHWCNVLINLDCSQSHAVLMDQDGVIYDPLRDQPYYSANHFDLYSKVYSVAGLWRPDYVVPGVG
jgi:hypothetical protein